MRVPKDCTNCGKPRDPKIKTLPYKSDFDDPGPYTGDTPRHRAVFCSQGCRVDFIRTLDPELTPDERLAKAKQDRT